MTNDLAAAVRRAAQALRVSDVTSATNLIQDALFRRPSEPVPETPDRQRKAAPQPSRPPLSGFPRRPLRDVLAALSQHKKVTGAFGALSARTVRASPPVADGARFLSRSFTCAAGTRAFKLYIPASVSRGEAAQGLIVMLHGCRQDSNDFAVGTNMNAQADKHDLIVAYPEQSGAANPSACWNWFRPSDQNRDAGEPSIIAGVTRSLVAEYALDPTKVFVAGLSAGGAMAVVMGETYPDLYTGVGVHSGLSYRSATDVVSAFAAMRGDVQPAWPSMVDASTSRHRPSRTIVFHGTADQTVHPMNAGQIVEAARRAAGDLERQERGLAQGRSYTQTVTSGPDGTTFVECWLIDGAGHGWSGGSAAGSFTDQKGPAASAEMVRFFLKQ